MFSSSRYRLALLLTSIGVSLSLSALATELPKTPRVLDKRLKLELVAESPNIVTPVGITFDGDGRLLVIESHTHFPPKGYQGPKKDRIRILQDTNGDGRADKFQTFLEGTEKTMSLRAGPDGWIYVATRRMIFRTRDTDGDGKADKRLTLATLETDGDYPHNGLCGLCFDGRGHLYFGLGENLGKSYSLVSRTGTKLSGGGEGGNIYRCRLDGSQLKQVATGFWNPFGICIDGAGRLFTVGNDPDASPPCRLVQIVEGGDYGYQFRYGRSGKHPLQAWDGELPGTLPMVAGTSEAPSAILPWFGQMYCTSWGEYRIERFRLKHQGASVSADREVVVQGDNQFRPVDFAIAPDGSLYFTDWVDRSYNVHGKGRVWRLSWKDKPQSSKSLPLSSGEKRAERARLQRDRQALASDDPFLHQAAVTGFVRTGPVRVADFRGESSGRVRLGLLQAARRSNVNDSQRAAWLDAALSDRSANVRLYAVRWIADASLKSYRGRLAKLLNDKQVSSIALFKAAVAAIEWLDTGRVVRRQLAGESALLEALKNRERPQMQVMALKALPSDHKQLSPSYLVEMIRDVRLNAAVRREAARALSIRSDAKKSERLLKVAGDDSLNAGLRADLVAGMPVGGAATKASINKLAAQPGIVAKQAAAWLRWNGDNNKSTAALPQPTETAAWMRKLSGPGDADRGWRVFFGQHAARCANCHRLDGRGADVGPDLTSIGKRVGKQRLLESILQPSREISPRFVPWVIKTDDGKVFSALSLGVPGSREMEEFLGADGKRFSISRNDIATRKLSNKSIMPDGLHQQLLPSELRDLLVLLSQ